MPKRFALNNVISLISLIIITFLVLFYIYLSFSFNNQINLLRSSIFTTNLQNYKILNYTHYIVFSLIIFAIILMVCLILIKSHKKMVLQKENIIIEQREEIEKQKKLIENITVLYNNTAECDRLKTEFFSSISHELKTPICIILGAIQLLDQNKPAHIAEERRATKHFEAIKHNCYRLLRLINNLLDITKIDSGYIKINPVNCNIVCLVEEITQSVAPFARNRDIMLEFDTEDEEIFTAVDIDKIERIILNLLSNAIKFTPQGGIIKIDMARSGNSVYIHIRDNGPGIPKNMQNTIFERFKQVNSSLTREFEGSGIGLSLVKSFVELHNGNIKLISEENKGSEFIIELPISLCELNKIDSLYIKNSQDKIIEAINIEFSDIYSLSS